MTFHVYSELHSMGVHTIIQINDTSQHMTKWTTLMLNQKCGGTLTPHTINNVTQKVNKYTKHTLKDVHTHLNH